MWYNHYADTMSTKNGKEIYTMYQLPKIALGAWAWGNDGTFGGSLTAQPLKPTFDAATNRGLNL